VIQNDIVSPLQSRRALVYLLVTRSSVAVATIRVPHSGHLSLLARRSYPHRPQTPAFARPRRRSRRQMPAIQMSGKTANPATT
jgi:hypothetical protein